MKKYCIGFVLFLGALISTACQANVPRLADTGMPRVLVIESFLADLVQNIAGERLQLETLIPLGVDPHSYEPTPRDLTIISEADALVMNGAGFEEWLEESLQNAGGARLVITAADGLEPRVLQPGEVADEHGEGDPHFWLDPTLAARYVENIRDGLIELDPEGREIYSEQADAYLSELRTLDEWISMQIDTIPIENRLLVTNHESFGYYAARYGFRVVGTIIPSASSSASPSAQQMASLIDSIRQEGVRAVFLETGTNPDLADQIAQETGIRVVSGLYSHSISPADGPAPTYLEMMRYNTRLIVEALR